MKITKPVVRSTDAQSHSRNLAEQPIGVHEWSPAGLIEVPDSGGTLLVADSWLVTEGRVRALEHHRDRFTAACRTGHHGAATNDLDVDAFWAAATNLLPAHGSWFPRVELVRPHGPARLRIRLRPAPPPGSGIRLWGTPVVDPRLRPRVKGPDLDLLGDLRRPLAERGAGEILLTTDSGVIVEATTASVCWWEGDRLCVPDPRIPSLPGITLGLVVDRARRLGIEVVPSRRRIADLAGQEVWLLNALHGIRPVTAWVGTALSAGQASRAAQWQSWLAGLAQELHS